MKKINVAINGFGRIGRVFFRIAFANPTINIVAINDITDSKTLAHLLKYDSVHGKFNGEIKHDNDHIYINGNEIKIFASKDPENLPWKALDIDIVIESTGHFLTRETAQKHLTAGAKKIILSAPATDDTIKTIVLGVNDELLSSDDIIVSNASCTTNCASPMLKVLRQIATPSMGSAQTLRQFLGGLANYPKATKDLEIAEKELSEAENTNKKPEPTKSHSR